MKDKIKSGIIHCANYMCKGCPYEAKMHEAMEEMCTTAAGYVRCMQKLIDDIYNEMKEVKEND